MFRTRPWLLLVLIAWGCGGETRTVELRRVVPAADPDCGRAPANGLILQVTAFGEFTSDRVTTTGSPLVAGEALILDGLPLETRVLHAGVFGDQVLTAGKTAPFDFTVLDDGAVVAAFMAPPDGVCPTGPPLVARAGARVARAGGGAVVGGGVDEGDRAVGLVEFYDPTTGSFTDLGLWSYGPDEFGLLGASLTGLPAAVDGSVGPRVVVAGGSGSGYRVYDVTTNELSAAFLLDPGRAHHAAVALDHQTVLLAGGCDPPLQASPLGACAPGSLLTTTSVIDLEAGEVRRGPDLLRPRVGGQLLRVAHRAVLLVGGTDDSGPVTDLERIQLGDPDGPATDTSELIAGDHPVGAAAVMASGAVFLGFAGPEGPPSDLVSVLPPAAGAVTALEPSPVPRGGATATALQNGRVLVIGGDPAGAIGLHQPAFEEIATLAGGALDVREHGAVLLDDGTVLVVGGRASDSAALARASIVRPDLTGPFASGVDLAFGAGAGGPWIPGDPARSELREEEGGDIAHALLTSSGGGGALPAEWAVIAGPVLTSGRIRVVARAARGGLAVLTSFRSPGDHVALVLLPGQPATLYALDRGDLEVVGPCQGEPVAADLFSREGVPAVIEVEFGAGPVPTVTATADGQPILDCSGIDPLPAGLVGVGVVGDSGDQLRIDSVTVRR